MRILYEALEMNRAEIEAGLQEAQRELDELNQRKNELEALIARAKAALGEAGHAAASQARRRTLHDAMAQVLHEHGNRWMTVRELADEVNRRALYEKRDRSPVEPNQIHARAKNYSALFDKEGPRVRLRSSS
jgi:peptidoglycan hydrolase CwlO-like protein